MISIRSFQPSINITSEIGATQGKRGMRRRGDPTLRGRNGESSEPPGSIPARGSVAGGESSSPAPAGKGRGRPGLLGVPTVSPRAPNEGPLSRGCQVPSWLLNHMRRFQPFVELPCRCSLPTAWQLAAPQNAAPRNTAPQNAAPSAGSRFPRPHGGRSPHHPVQHQPLAVAPPGGSSSPSLPWCEDVHEPECCWAPHPAGSGVPDARGLGESAQQPHW